MPDGQNPNGPNYDDDFYAWTQHQAEVLRSMPTMTIASTASTSPRRSRLGTELSRRRAQPGQAHPRTFPETGLFAGRRSSIWLDAIDYRGAEMLEDQLSATLRRDIDTSLPRLYRGARKQAELSLREYGENQAADALPTTCPYALEQILDSDWYPEPPAQERDMTRDFVGYSVEPPHAHWPGDARIAVNFVINFEEARSCRTRPGTASRRPG